MKKLILIFCLFVLFLPLIRTPRYRSGTFFLAPLEITEAAGLVPCGRSVDDPETPDINESQPCTACDLLVLLQNVLHFALTIAFLIVVIFAIVGGFRWILSGGNEENIKAGQKTLSSALIGLVIILCAWLIVNTVFWLVKTIGGEDYTGTGALPWFQLECTYPESNTNNGGSNGDGGGDGGGNGGDGGGTTENWCSDMAGYACVNDIYGNGVWNANCDSTTVVVPNPYSHCPEGTICCIPLDESKIIAKPKNPDTGDEGGPCEGGKLLKLCSDYSICEPRPQCEIDQGLTPTNLCHGGDVMRCPEACVHECNPEGDSSDCN